MGASDLRGVAQLATQATSGVVDIAEATHQSVLNTFGIRGADGPGKARGIPGFVYNTLRAVTGLVGRGLDSLLASLQVADAGDSGSFQRQAVLAALNGVLGDHLAASKNPLAIPMSLRYRNQALEWRSLPADFQPTGKVLLLVHGLCMNDLQWPVLRGGGSADHGQALALAHGYTPLYLRYNSGQHISENGQLFSEMLQEMVSCWPVPIEEISVIAHSMGGLVTRAAIHQAHQESRAWPRYLKHLVFLGTPHHGSHLERAGNWVDRFLASNPYTAPFASLGKIRSAGITDLRHGFVLDEHWRGKDRFGGLSVSHTPLALPEGVACYAVAATIRGGSLTDRLLGDGLVPLASALGQHPQESRALHFTDSLTLYGKNHLDLLSDPSVALQLHNWLTQENDKAIGARKPSEPSELPGPWNA